MRPGDGLRAEAARSDREHRRLEGVLLGDLKPIERQKLSALTALHGARAKLFDRCAETADVCGSISRCAGGHESIWGALATPEERDAWLAQHAACEPEEPAIEAVRIRFPTEAEAREIERDLRPTHVVGRVGYALFVKARRGT